MLCPLPLHQRCRCSRPPPLVAEPSRSTSWRGATWSGKTSRLTCWLPSCSSKLSSAERGRCWRPLVVDLLSSWRSLRGSKRSCSLRGVRERLLKRRELHESSLRLRRPRRSSLSSSSPRRPSMATGAGSWRSRGVRSPSTTLNAHLNSWVEQRLSLSGGSSTRSRWTMTRKWEPERRAGGVAPSQTNDNLWEIVSQVTLGMQDRSSIQA
jgi:hypothetical protein